jgi:hypothetical protein
MVMSPAGVGTKDDYAGEALGRLSLLTEISTRNLAGGKGQPARKADNFTTICEPTV